MTLRINGKTLKNESKRCFYSKIKILKTNRKRIIIKTINSNKDYGRNRKRIEY